MITSYITHLILEQCLENIGNKFVANFSDMKMEGVLIFAMHRESSTAALCMGMSINTEYLTNGRNKSVHVTGCESNWTFGPDMGCKLYDTEPITSIHGHLSEFRYVKLSGTMNDMMSESIHILEKFRQSI